MEEKLAEESELVKSSGGVFEVEDNGVLIFSKKELHRFPQDDEILEIIRFRSEGMNLSDAKMQVSKDISPPPSFTEWFSRFLSRGSSAR